MKNSLIYCSCLLLLLFSFHYSGQCQVKKKIPSLSHTKKKPATGEKRFFFKTEEEARKWIYDDSIKRRTVYISDSIKQAFQDSVNYIKDSIAGEIELKKRKEAFYEVHEQFLFPKDSLNYVDVLTASLIKANSTVDVDSACIIIAKHFSTSLQKARAVFYWVASTVQYDWLGFRNNFILPIFNEDENAAVTFKNKRGVCQNYSNLYKYMCKKIGVECKTILGWGKNFPICITGDIDKDPNHAWNAVKTNKGWMLLDATWACRDTTGKVDSYWFNTAPEEFIYNHFPEDSSNQFLKSRVSKTEFSNFPIVSDDFFKSKFDFDVPQNGSLLATGKKFSISKPLSQTNYSITYSLIPYKGTRMSNYSGDDETPDVETTAVIDKKNKSVDYEMDFPSKGVWWLCITIDKKIKNQYIDNVSFYRALMLKVTYR
ncbi:transglutaminase domain-containing protein [Ferruginibacter sp.]